MVDVIFLHHQEVIRAGMLKFMEDVPELNILQMSSMEEAEEAIASHPDAVFVSDVMLDDQETYRLLRLAKRSVAFTRSENPTHVARAIAAGVVDFIPATADEKELVRRLLAVAKNDAQPGPEFRRVHGSMHSRSKISTAPAHVLTPRECQTLRCLSYGLSNEEISRVCDISIETVKEHVQHMLRKLDVEDRTQAAVWYVRMIELAQVAKQ